MDSLNNNNSKSLQIGDAKPLKISELKGIPNLEKFDSEEELQRKIREEQDILVKIQSKQAVIKEFYEQKDSTLYQDLFYYYQNSKEELQKLEAENGQLSDKVKSLLEDIKTGNAENETLRKNLLEKKHITFLSKVKKHGTIRQ